MNPKKKWHSKARTGCVRCKIRRIKCDETKPECQRCRKAGYKCGYDVPQTKIFQIGDSLKFDDPTDRRFYDFFVNEGSSLLTTFQLTTAPLWLNLVPQLSRLNPAVQHAITALGAVQAPLHYGLPGAVVERRQPEMSHTALHYLVKAMHDLTKADPNSVSPEVPLTCCLCFMAISIWTEKIGAPVMHINAALQMLREYQAMAKKNPLRRSKLLEEYFTETINRMVINACALSDNYPTPKSGISANYALDMGLDSAGDVLTFPDAIDCISTILKCIARVNDGQTADGIDAKINCALSRYKNSLEELRRRDVEAAKKRGRLETVHLHDYEHLQIHHRVAYIMFHALKAKKEMDFDAFADDFHFILDTCRHHLARAVELGSSHAGNLQTSLGVIPPLFFTATKCRNREIRRNALQLLHDSSRCERRWSSCMATTIARFVIETEQQGVAEPTAEFVPLQNRITLERVEHSGADQLTHLEYRFCTDDINMPNRSVSLPYRPHRLVETGGVTDSMTRKVLRACGYTGIMLFIPRISCHCPAGVELPPSTVEWPGNPPRSLVAKFWAVSEGQRKPAGVSTRTCIHRQPS